jgi:hypothetical protein
VVGEEQSSTAEQVRDRIPRDRPLGVIHSGGRYLYGFGPDSYGIWDAANEGAPVEEFPATKQGRHEGWRRYLELEPAAQKIPPEQMPVREEQEEIEARPRRGGILIGGGIALALIIGLVVFLGTRSDEAGPGGSGGGPVKGPTVTHLDVTGAATLSEDLKQTKFQPPAPGFSNRHMIAEWKGTSSRIKFDFDDPVPGDYTTGQLPRLRVLEFFFTPTGATEEIHIRSVQGECEVKIEHADTSALSGSYECLGVPFPESEETIDLKGTFFAKET